MQDDCNFDPQKSLEIMRELACAVLDRNYPYLGTHALEIAAQFLALDESLMSGGSLPMDWLVAQAVRLQYNARTSDKPRREGARERLARLRLRGVQSLQDGR